MNQIEIKKDWRDKSHLELLSNAIKSLSELGALSEVEVEKIKLKIKEQDDGQTYTS